METTMKKSPFGFTGARGLIIILAASLFLYSCSGKKEEPQYDDFEGLKGKNSQSELLIQDLKAKLYENPENIQLLSALGDAYFNQGRFLEAIGEYEKVLKINSENADCLNDVGLAYFYTGNTGAALDSVKKAVKVNPEYKYAWLSMGFMLTSLERYDEALPALTRVKELDAGGPLAEEAENFMKRINEIKGTK